ncbi:MAG: hypothetical protein GEU75_15385 [Dehalococcoidia bacterium]|nr:hypothetical protein [Dehalococcoidia bacterium]
MSDDILRPSDWIYYKLYVGSALAGLNELIIQTIPLTLALDGWDRWFFIRYFDEDGLHIRLRLRARPGESARLAGQVQEVCVAGLERLPSLPPSEYRPMVLPPGGQGQDGAFLATMKVALKSEQYEPELDKFGGVGGMPVAEAAFQESSEIAVSLLRDERDGQLSRKTLAPCLMAAAFAAFPDLGGPDAFWRRYALYWLGGDNAVSVEWRERFVGKGEELRAREVPIVARAEELSEGAGTLVARWEAALADAAGAYRALGHSEVADESLLLNFIHLMNNRLGLTPLEEAYLATLLEHQAAAVASV